MAKDPTQVADKWRRNLSASGQDIINGVNAVTTNPAQKAIAQKQKALLNYQAAMNNGKWERGLQRVTLESWKSDMINKGVQRIAQGATSGQPKMQEFMTKLLPYQDSLRSKLSTLPKQTIDDSIERMRVWIMGMSEFKR